MVRIPLPFPDSSLELQPRFAGYPIVVQVPLLLGLVVAPLALTLWLYRYELRLVTPTAARTLLTLRLLVVGLLIFVPGFQPTVAHSAHEDLPGRVIVAVDRSDSMTVADPQRPLLEKLKLARGLKLAEDLCPNSLLDTWIKQLEAGGQIRLRPSDTERRQLEQVGRRIDGLSRGQLARAVLAAENGGLIEAIQKKHRLELFGFGASISPLLPDQLDSLKSSAGPAGALTDLRLPLGRGLEQPAGGESGPPLAVVLLTDGQHNANGSPTEKAVELGAVHVPVYSIAVGSRLPPIDIAITATRAPIAVFKGSDIAVEARVEIHGLGEREVTVELRRLGKSTMTETIRHTGGDRSYPVRFQMRMDEVGPQTLTVHATPDPDETRTENNTRRLTVNVADDKAKVLIIEGEARWEFHYLASALARDRGMDVKSVVFEQPRIGRVSDADLERTGHPSLKLPAEPDALASFDCIVLGDVAPDNLSDDNRTALEKYVGERGGTLVVLAGKRGMPLAYPGDNEPLRRLLPIVDPHVLATPDGFPVALTAEGRQTAYLQMEPTPEASESRWSKLPKHFWAIVGKAKPGATVLATVRLDDAKEDADSALIVRQNFGLGRVLFVGLDSTWRWRYMAGDTYHHRFWGQVMRWAASDKPLVAGNDSVRFGTRAPSYTQGQDVELAARLSDTVKLLTANALAGARVVRLREGQPDEDVSLVNLSRLDARPRELTGKLSGLTPGQYAVELEIPEMVDKLLGPPGRDGQPTKLRAPFTVTPADNKEMEDLATNLPLLEEIAAKTGGRVFAPEEASALADLLAKRASTRTFHQESKLSQSWWTLLVFLLLLTMEWVGRKWVGLP